MKLRILFVWFSFLIGLNAQERDGDSFDLSGAWELGNGITVEIVQSGGSLEARFGTYPKNEYGIGTGDSVFSGNVSGENVGGEVVLRGKKEDGSIVTNKGKLSLVYDAQNRSLSGEYENRRFSSKSGKWTDETRMQSFSLARTEEAEIYFLEKQNPVDLSREGEFQEPVSGIQGRPFWVKLEFEYSPRSDAYSVELEAQSGAVSRVEARRSEEDEKVFIGGPVVVDREDEAKKPFSNDDRLDRKGRQQGAAGKLSEEMSALVGVWHTSYTDALLGEVKGTADIKVGSGSSLVAVVDWTDPESNEVFQLKTNSVEKEGEAYRMTFQGRSPSRSFVSTGKENGESMEGAAVVKVPNGARNEVTAKFNKKEQSLRVDPVFTIAPKEMVLKLKPDEKGVTLEGEWSLEGAISTGFIRERSGELDVEKIQMSGKEIWKRSDIFVTSVKETKPIESYEALRDKPSFTKDGRVLAQVELRIKGHDLPEPDRAKVSFEDKKIKALGAARRDQGDEEALLVDVELSGDVTPGDKTMFLNQAKGVWKLELEGTDPIRISFVVSGSELDRADPRLFDEDVFEVEAEYDFLPEYDSIEYELWVEGGSERSLSMSKTTDDPRVFRSDFMALSVYGKGGKPSEGESYRKVVAENESIIRAGKAGARVNVGDRVATATAAGGKTETRLVVRHPSQPKGKDGLGAVLWDTPFFVEVAMDREAAEELGPRIELKVEHFDGTYGEKQDEGSFYLSSDNSGAVGDVVYSMERPATARKGEHMTETTNFAGMAFDFTESWGIQPDNGDKLVFTYEDKEKGLDVYRNEGDMDIGRYLRSLQTLARLYSAFLTHPDMPARERDITQFRYMYAMKGISQIDKHKEMHNVYTAAKVGEAYLSVASGYGTGRFEYSKRRVYNYLANAVMRAIREGEDKFTEAYIRGMGQVSLGLYEFYLTFSEAGDLNMIIWGVDPMTGKKVSMGERVFAYVQFITFEAVMGHIGDELSGGSSLKGRRFAEGGPGKGRLDDFAGGGGKTKNRYGGGAGSGSKPDLDLPSGAKSSSSGAGAGVRSGSKDTDLDGGAKPVDDDGLAGSTKPNENLTKTNKVDDDFDDNLTKTLKEEDGFDDNLTKTLKEEDGFDESLEESGASSADEGGATGAKDPDAETASSGNGTGADTADGDALDLEAIKKQFGEGTDTVTSGGTKSGGDSGGGQSGGPQGGQPVREGEPSLEEMQEFFGAGGTNRETLNTNAPGTKTGGDAYDEYEFFSDDELRRLLEGEPVRVREPADPGVLRQRGNEVFTGDTAGLAPPNMDAIRNRVSQLEGAELERAIDDLNFMENARRNMTAEQRALSDEAIRIIDELSLRSPSVAGLDRLEIMKQTHLDAITGGKTADELVSNLLNRNGLSATPTKVAMNKGALDITDDIDFDPAAEDLTRTRGPATEADFEDTFVGGNQSSTGSQSSTAGDSSGTSGYEFGFGTEELAEFAPPNMEVIDDYFRRGIAEGDPRVFEDLAQLEVKERFRRGMDLESRQTSNAAIEGFERIRQYDESLNDSTPIEVMDGMDFFGSAHGNDPSAALAGYLISRHGGVDTNQLAAAMNISQAEARAAGTRALAKLAGVNTGTPRFRPDANVDLGFLRLRDGRFLE